MNYAQEEKYILHAFGSRVVRQRSSDGYFDAVELCQLYPNGDWGALNREQCYKWLRGLAIEQKGRHIDTGATIWLPAEEALLLAVWVSEKVAQWAANRFDRWKVAPAPPPALRPTIEVAGKPGKLGPEGFYVPTEENEYTTIYAGSLKVTNFQDGTRWVQQKDRQVILAQDPEGRLFVDGSQVVIESNTLKKL